MTRTRLFWVHQLKGGILNAHSVRSQAPLCCWNEEYLPNETCKQFWARLRATQLSASKPRLEEALSSGKMSHAASPVTTPNSSKREFKSPPFPSVRLWTSRFPVRSQFL